MSIKQKLSLMKQDAKVEWSDLTNKVVKSASSYKNNIKKNGFMVKHIFWGFFLSLNIFAMFMATSVFIVGEILAPIFSKVGHSIWNLKLTR